jgi:hypothetical protein
VVAPFSLERGALLVGPYSRFGWHHPGPLYFYLLAPWYWMSGLHTAGMQAGAFAINFSAVLLMAWTIATCASAPTAIDYDALKIAASAASTRG